MAETLKALGAVAVGGKAQERRKAVLEKRETAVQREARCKAGRVALGLLTDREKEELRHQPASLHGLANRQDRLGPAAGVELKEAQDGLAWVSAQEKGVWAELANLRSQVLRAHQGAEALAERLGGVLVPEGELVTTRVAGPTPPSRLSEEVHLIAVSVVQVQDLLEGLLGRLDL